MMSTNKIIRYTNAELRCTKCKKKENDLQGVMVAHGKGHYVRYEDFKQMENLCKKLMKQHSDISCENIRLRNAGYAMAIKINVHGIADRFTDSQKLVDDWSAAAKEGKPTK